MDAAGWGAVKSMDQIIWKAHSRRHLDDIHNCPKTVRRNTWRWTKVQIKSVGNAVDLIVIA